MFIFLTIKQLISNHFSQIYTKLCTTVMVLKKRLKIEKYLKQKYLIVQKLYHDKSQLKVNKIKKKKIQLEK